MASCLVRTRLGREGQPACWTEDNPAPRDLWRRLIAYMEFYLIYQLGLNLREVHRNGICEPLGTDAAVDPMRRSASPAFRGEGDAICPRAEAPWRSGAPAVA